MISGYSSVFTIKRVIARTHGPTTHWEVALEFKDSNILEHIKVTYSRASLRANLSNHPGMEIRLKALPCPKLSVASITEPRNDKTYIVQVFVDHTQMDGNIRMFSMEHLNALWSTNDPHKFNSLYAPVFE